MELGAPAPEAHMPQRHSGYGVRSVCLEFGVCLKSGAQCSCARGAYATAGVRSHPPHTGVRHTILFLLRFSHTDAPTPPYAVVLSTSFSSFSSFPSSSFSCVASRLALFAAA